MNAEIAGMTVRVNDLTIKFYEDESPDNSRDWDNLGKMICFHKRYDLGDNHYLRSEAFKDWTDLGLWLVEENDAVVILPLYLLDHSGLALNTTGYESYDSQPCDWGQVGFIFATREAVSRIYAVAEVTKEALLEAEERLKREVETYSEYLAGGALRFTIEDANGEILESLGGYYDVDAAKRDAKSFARALAAEHVHTEEAGPGC
jgi:hypothetical protein